MELEGFTKAGEPLRLRQAGAVKLIELKSPVHGQWITVAEHNNWQAAHADYESWVKGNARTS